MNEVDYDKYTGHTLDRLEVVDHSWSDTGFYVDGVRIGELSIGDYATEATQGRLEAEMEANALLITDAPKLLERCQKYEAMINDDGSLSTHEEHVDILADAMHALSVIDKAVVGMEEAKQRCRKLELALEAAADLLTVLDEEIDVAQLDNTAQAADEPRTRIEEVSS